MTDAGGDGAPRADLLEKADVALYRAKTLGRNRIDGLLPLAV